MQEIKSLEHIITKKLVNQTLAYTFAFILTSLVNNNNLLGQYLLQILRRMLLSRFHRF